MCQIKKWSRITKKDRIILFLLIACFGNAVLFLMKLFFSIMFSSLWFGVNALFQFILMLLRGSSFYDYQRIERESRHCVIEQIAYHNYIRHGILLILLGFVYFGVNIFIYFHGTNTNLPEYLTYLVALFAFCSVGTSLYGLFKQRKESSLFLLAIYKSKFAASLTSIVLTQVILLDTFETSLDLRVVNGSTGMLVSILFLGMGLFMVFQKKVV